MFTGIVETLGKIVALQRRGGGARLVVRAPGAAKELALGDSIAVNGACVTVVECNGEVFAADLVPETVARTNLGILQIDEEVNLEMPVRAADRLGGHIVQGHIDAVGVVRARRKVGAQEMLEVTVPFELTKYLAPQGSVAVDGVSLTVVGVDRDRFRVALIPHTVESTTLGRKGQQASVNVEVDVLSKYVERHMAARNARTSLASLFDDVPRERHEPQPDPTHVSAPLRKPAPPPRKAPNPPRKMVPVRAEAKPRAEADAKGSSSKPSRPARKPAARSAAKSSVAKSSAAKKRRR